MPYGEILQGSQYLEAEKILDESWRAGDSIWSLVPESKLEGVISHIKALLSEDRLVEFMRDADRQRLKVGQATFTIAQK